MSLFVILMQRRLKALVVKVEDGSSLYRSTFAKLSSDFFFHERTALHIFRHLNLSSVAALSEQRRNEEEEKEEARMYTVAPQRITFFFPCTSVRFSFALVFVIPWIPKCLFLLLCTCVFSLCNDWDCSRLRIEPIEPEKKNAHLLAKSARKMWSHYYTDFEIERKCMMKYTLADNIFSPVKIYLVLFKANILHFCVSTFYIYTNYIL